MHSWFEYGEIRTETTWSQAVAVAAGPRRAANGEESLGGRRLVEGEEWAEVVRVPAATWRSDQVQQPWDGGLRVQTETQKNWEMQT